MILDLTNERGLFCGKVLADLGYDVIKIEKPGGDDCRKIGPFINGVQDPDFSILWYAFNRGKKGMILDLAHTKGRKAFLDLIKSAEAVIESFDPGYLDSLDLGYDKIKSINPGIVLTSISPFGLTGPFKDWKATDLTVMASSGLLYLSGDSDRCPVRISVPLTYALGSLEAASATCMALYHSKRTGEGQHVDVSLQQSTALFTQATTLSWELEGKQMKRRGQFRPEVRPELGVRQLWPCKDGWVSFALYGGKTGERNNQRLVAWMNDEGYADDFLKSVDWANPLDKEHFDKISTRLSRFFADYNQKDLYEQALKRGVILLPVYNIADICTDPQLAARNFWMNVELPSSNESLCPGCFAQTHHQMVKPGLKAPMLKDYKKEKSYSQKVDGRP